MVRSPRHIFTESLLQLPQSPSVWLSAWQRTNDNVCRVSHAFAFRNSDHYAFAQSNINRLSTFKICTSAGSFNSFGLDSNFQIDCKSQDGIHPFPPVFSQRKSSLSNGAGCRVLRVQVLGNLEGFGKRCWVILLFLLYWMAGQLVLFSAINSTNMSHVRARRGWFAIWILTENSLKFEFKPTPQEQKRKDTSATSFILRTDMQTAE